MSHHSPSSFTNHYLTLHIPSTASRALIKSAYKTLALKQHPDKNPLHLKKSCIEKFQRISEAVEVLGDEVKRREYDARYREQLRKWERRGEEVLFREEGKEGHCWNGWSGDVKEVDKRGYEYAGRSGRGHVENRFRPKTKAWRKRKRELREQKEKAAAASSSSCSGDEGDGFDVEGEASRSGTCEDGLEYVFHGDATGSDVFTGSIQLDHGAYLLEYDLLPLYTGHSFRTKDDPVREPGDSFAAETETSESSVQHGYDDGPVDGPGKDKTRKAGRASPLMEMEKMFEQKKEAREGEGNV